jgi:XTP/dITP diphosphohydrolase
MSCKLLIATNNRGKLAEYRDLLAGLDLVTLSEAGVTEAVEETGTTYVENARLKARAAAARSGLTALGDDSGLEVDALEGAPGVMSARYAGEHTSDADRINLLLNQLAGVPWQKRTARFRCVIALSTPSGEVAICEGKCEGFISLEPKGTGGHGYDPVFFMPELDMTMAQLPLDLKDRVSHRARAASQVPVLLARPPFSC